MIPKIIHYCWLSGEKKPETVAKCIESWKKHLPDFQIKCWDASCFDQINATFAKQAFNNRKWAFASDYIRLYALFNEGGIYLDSDVQVWGSIDDWLEYDFFTGVETRDKEHTDLWAEAAIMGSAKNNQLIGEMLDLYNSRVFVKPDGTLDLTPIPTVITPIIEERLGWQRSTKTQYLLDNSIIFGIDSIANSNVSRHPRVRLYHLNNRSWIPLTFKEKLLRLLGII